MCWHILALFYVVNVRYVFYITYSSQSSCVLSYLCMKVCIMGSFAIFRRYLVH